MRQRLAMLCALLAATSVAHAIGEDLNKVEIKATRVSGNIYMLQGAGGNIAASVGEDGIVLVDDEFAPLATKIGAALKALGITDKPVRFILNTHYHFDHTGGNLPFANDGATLIAHDNARARLITGGSANNGGSVGFEMKPAEPGALPVITFEHDVSVHLNGEDIRALHYPAAHTDGDAIIFFPKANVVHMGDIFVQHRFPFIDVNAGGSLQGLIKACEGVISKLPADVKVIPGHGDLSNLDEIRAYVTMLKDTSAVVSAALKKGKTADQMKQEHVLAAWSQGYSGDFINTDAYIDTLVYSLTNRKNTPFIKHN